jgi:hypothetical protein
MRDSVVKWWERSRGVTTGENGPRFSEVFASGEPKATLSAHTPAFTVVEAGWMLVFGTSRVAALLFMAALAAGTAVLIFGTVQREFGNWAAAAGVLLWVCAPSVRESYEMIMPDMFSALVLTGAILLWARLLKNGHFRNALWCVLLSPVVIFGDGGVLLLAIPVFLMLLAGRRLPALARPATWIAVSLVLMLVGFWMWQQPSLAWRTEPRAIAYWSRGVGSILGLAASAFAIGGLVIRWRSGKGIGTIWMAMASLVLGALLARWIATSELEMRSLIPMTPAFAMLAVAGAVSLAGTGAEHAPTARARRRREILWVFLLLLLATPQCILHDHPKDWQGFGPIALTLLDEAPRDARVLVVSDPRGEGMLLSEIAMHDRRTGISIEQGSKTLVNPTGLSPRGRPLERFDDDEHLAAYLASRGIDYIVLDSSVPEKTRAGYHDQIRALLEENARKFWPVYQSPITRDGEPQGHPLRIFRVMAAG